MAEYAGYIGNQYPPTDWSKIGANLLGQIDQEKERRKVEKEKIIQNLPAGIMHGL